MIHAVPFLLLSNTLVSKRYLVSDIRPFSGSCLEGVSGTLDLFDLALIETAERHGADISVKLDL